MTPHKPAICLLQLIPGQCYENVSTCSKTDGVFNECGEIFFTGEQFQLPKLVIQVD